MASDGWIKLHRSLLDKGFSTDPEYIALWVYLLLRAGHDKKEVLLDGKIKPLLPGQFVTSRPKMCMATGIERNKLERILKCFESEHQIEQQTFSKYRIISIINWNKYQQTEQQNEPQMSSKRATSEQQVSTNKNVRIKEVKKKALCDYPEIFEPDEKHLAMARDANVDVFRELQRFRDFHSAKGNQFKDWAAAFRTWLGNAKRWNEEKNPSPSMTGLDKEALRQQELADLREKGAI